MKRINVSSVQQYTIDRLRVSLNGSYETELLEKLTFRLCRLDGTDIANRLRSVWESNHEEWQYILESNTFDIYLCENTQIENGTYRFTLIRDGEEIYQTSVPLAHMEDIRIEFDKVEAVDLQTLHVTLKPISSYYQSVEMMKLMKFSIIETDSGIQYNEVFQGLGEVLDLTEGNVIKEFTLKVKSGKSLPPGYYDIRFTSPYKSRTFSIVEKIKIKLPFMTTTPPQITSIKVARQSVTKQTVLSVIFSPFLEKGMMLSAKREIIRERGNLNISDFFDASRLSTISYTIAGISYITRIELPLADTMYSLEKGKYIFRYSWPDAMMPTPPVEFHFEVDWVVKELQNIGIINGKYIDFDIWDPCVSKDFVSNYNVLVERNGKEIDPTGIFGDLNQSAFIEDGSIVAVSDHYGIPILDMSKIEDGTYSFLLWTVRSADPNGFAGDIYYNYIGNIDIVGCLTPQIKEVYQSNVDALTIVLEHPLPISSLIQCELHLYDEYGRIDFSDRLVDIENSNIWQPAQMVASRFDVVVRSDKVLSSGRYQFKMSFRSKESNTLHADIAHVESRRGFIEKIEQISINKVKITFSEPQSRQFLLTTKLRVRMGNDTGSAKWYEERFELLENVLKADQAQFKEFELMMDHEDSLPAGRYQFIFEFNNGEHEISTLIYSYTVELGYMTNNIPKIKCINPVIIEEGEYAGRLGLEVYFKADLEIELYNKAIFSLIRDSDKVDIESDFEEKEEWITVEDAKLSESKYKTLITIPALTRDLAHIERGLYNMVFSWEGIIPYLENLEKEVFLEYYLPKVKSCEVVDMDMPRRWGRIYFELDTVMQYSYYEHLKVEVLNDIGVDCTEYFDTVFNSNKIDPSLPDSQKLPSNSFNLDILRVDKLETGKYQFIFYTDHTGIRQSDWIATLDVRQALRPIIINAQQINLSQIEITLQEAIPRRLLEEMTIRFRNANKMDHSDDFLTIDQANYWPEELREVSTFVIELKGGKILERGTYDFALMNGTYLCDDYIFDIIWMEGAYGDIEYIEPKKINTVWMKFKNRESRELFKTLKLYVEEAETGKDMQAHFGDPGKGLMQIDTTYFDLIELEVTKPIKQGRYNFRWERVYAEKYDMQLPDNEIFLPFLSNEKPVLRSVTSTRKGDDMLGDDAIIMWFSPPLEKTLFDSAAFGIRKALNVSVNVTDHFKHITTAELETIFDDYGNEYVEFATLDYEKMVTLNRDRYSFIFQWTDELHKNYMDEISKEENMNYILFPFKLIEQIDPETIKCTFRTPVKGEDMLKSEVWVFSDKSVMTGDGLITEEVNFTNQFLSLKKTNTFEAGETYAYVVVRMGTRDPENPAKAALPPARYRFIISKEPEEEDKEEYGLIYVYGGSCNIDFLVNSEMLYSPFTLTQRLYDRLKYVWDKLQFVEMLNMFSFKITRKDPTTEKIIDYSSYFMDVRDANYYYMQVNVDENGKTIIPTNYDIIPEGKRLPEDELTDKSQWIEGFYIEQKDYVVVFDEVQYKLPQTPSALVRLRDGCAIPGNTYQTAMVYHNNEYFKKEITLPFMTSKPPDIYSMYLEDDDFVENKKWLCVRFRPMAEWDSIHQSSFEIMTYRGQFKDGSIKGEDKTRFFGVTRDIIFTEPEVKDPEIRYVEMAKIPILPGAILPSGRYRLTWKWPSYSFFENSIYIGGLGLVGIGVKSARVIARDTIELVLEQKCLASDFKAMVLNVKGYHEGDVSERFMLLPDSNKDIPNDKKTETYYLKLDDGETINGDTYHFTLSQMVEEDNDDEEVTKIAIETCVWEMTIVYMTHDFPNLDCIDNLSVAKYEIVTLGNHNIENYIGREIQLTSSRNPHDIFTLTQADIEEYTGKTVKVYGLPRIDTLTAVFDEELDTSLIHALEMKVYNEDGMDMTESFKTPGESNRIDYRNVLYGVNITLNKYDLVGNIKKYDFYIQTADGRDLSGYFTSIVNSNQFTSDDNKAKTFSINVTKGNTIEEYDLEGLVVRLSDGTKKPIERFKSKLQLQTLQSIRMMDIKLADETTLSPGKFTFKFSYTNEPNVENCVWLYPFAYTGNMPFLSNNLGEIAEVIVVDFEHIDLVFSEQTLPVSAFNTFEMRLINSDGDEVDPTMFEPLMSTNQFGNASTLEELDDPGVIHLQLREGKTLASGTYRFQFWIDIAAHEFNGSGSDKDDTSEADNPEEFTDPVEVEFSHTGEYCLWDKYASLPIMFREMDNMIKKVEVVDIARIKITLAKKLALSVLKDFTVDLYDPLRDVSLLRKFASVDESNFFGMYIMPTSNQNILYSDDGAVWENFNTGYEYSYSKCFYHKPSKYFYALTGNGKIVRWNSFDKVATLNNPAVEVVKYAEKETRAAFNDFVIVGTTIIIVGNGGAIMKGTIDAAGKISLTNINENKKITKNTLSAILYNDGILLAVGQKGTILKSTNMGTTWVTIPSGVVYNLTDICYHKNSIQVEGELPDIDGEEEAESGKPIPEKVVEETIDTSGYFICGNSGTILVCNDFSEGFSKVKTTTKKSFFSITSHGDKLIIVGDAGIMVSIDDTEDGYIANIVEIEDCKFSLRDVAYCGKNFFVCGANGNWLSSKEGDNWTMSGTFTDEALRSITYIPSQYDADEADWFYLKVAQGQDIAPVNYYSGWKAPTLKSDFCEEWAEKEEYDEHLQDYYMQFELQDNRPKPVKYYHFTKTATINPLNGEDVDDVDNKRRFELDNVVYAWKECPGISPVHHASYFVRLRDRNKSDPDDWMYSTDKPVDLPYMTSKELKIKKVELHSPDDNPSVAYYKPYLKLTFENANENCFHYIRYSFLNGSTDCTKWFQSVRVAELNYTWSLGIESIDIFGANDLQLSMIKKGMYTLKWDWMAPGIAPAEDKYVTVTDIEVKNMVPFVESVTADDLENPRNVLIKFTKYVDSRFFLIANGFDMSMGKIPETKEEYERLEKVSINYYDRFESLEDSTNFLKVDHKIETVKENGMNVSVTKIKEAIISLHEQEILKSGEYLLKINNATKYGVEKEDDDTIWVTCTEKGTLDCKDELTAHPPVIRSVTLERHTAIPVRDDGGSSEYHSGETREDAEELLQSWITSGTAEDHVADRYTVRADDTTYYLVKREPPRTPDSDDDENPPVEPSTGEIPIEEEGDIEERTGAEYEWWSPSEEPYLCISFEADAMPMYKTFTERYKEYLFDEMRDSEPDKKGVVTQTSLIDFRKWFYQGLEYFEYDFSFITDVDEEVLKYISKLYIPFHPKCTDFPGCENGTFVLKFAEGCRYGTLIHKQIVLPRHIKSYGDIDKIVPKNPDITKDDTTAGFIIHFQKMLSKDFVRTMSAKVVWILSETQQKRLNTTKKEIDVTDRFNSIMNSTSDEFEDDTFDCLKKVNLFLGRGSYIDHGKYRVTLIGEKESDTLFDIPDTNPITMKKKVRTPWLSTSVPKEITAKLKISGAKNPMLTITFKDEKPPKSSIIKSKTDHSLNGWIIVTNNKTKDKYTGAFRRLANKTVKWAYDKELKEGRKMESAELWISAVRIPMADCAALPKGTYNVTFRFHPTSLLRNIPAPKKTGYCQFTTDKVAISKVGVINTVKCLDARRCKITIKKNAAISSNAKLKKSRVGQVMNVSNWKQLLGKLSLRMKKTKEPVKYYQKRFDLGNVKIGSDSLTYTIKPNYLLNPFTYKFYYVKGDSMPIRPRYREFQGLIWNKMGNAANDPRVWVILETEPNGKENCRVYKSYKRFLARKQKVKKINALIDYQYKLCKKCRKIKILSSAKASACIDSYDIPYQYTEGVAKFFKQLVKKWYTMRSKQTKITLGKGKKLNKQGKVVADKKNPEKKHVYHCSTAPFPGFEFEKRTEGKGEERQVSYGCANYIGKSTKWKYESRIATVKPGQFPADRSKIYFAILVIRPNGSDHTFYMKRGFKCTKKGKRSSAYKSYIKGLEKTITKREKACARCTNCKKKELASFGKKVIGWGEARFPVQVMSRAGMKSLPSLLNVAEKKGGFKAKKVNKKGCKSPSFVWGKANVTKTKVVNGKKKKVTKQYAILKCKNAKTLQSPLMITKGYQGIFYK